MGLSLFTHMAILSIMLVLYVCVIAAIFLIAAKDEEEFFDDFNK